MELKKSFGLRKVFTILYVVAVFVYAMIGFRPTVASADYDIYTNLNIPSILFSSNVARLSLENGELIAPDNIVGSFSRSKNKTLLIGHASTVFSDLNFAKLDDDIYYTGKRFIVTDIDMLEKNAVNMDAVLQSSAKETIILMTCAGDLYANGDASHRLIITAVLAE